VQQEIAIGKRNTLHETGNGQGWQYKHIHTDRQAPVPPAAAAFECTWNRFTCIKHPTVVRRTAIVFVVVFKVKHMLCTAQHSTAQSNRLYVVACGWQETESNISTNS
jgi:hypothetical protein